VLRSGAARAGPESAREIDEVVLHPSSPVFLDDDVESVLLLRVEVVEPGCEEAESPQLAPMVMVDVIVRVVVAPSLIVEGTDRLPGKELAGDRQVLSGGERIDRLPENRYQKVSDLVTDLERLRDAVSQTREQDESVESVS